MAIKGARHGVRGRGSYNVELKLEGQIFKFNLLTRQADVLLVTAAMTAQHDFARKYRDKVEENIRNGGKRFHYPPHSTKYAKWKAKLGGSSRLLYWSGAMAGSVVIRTEKSGTRFAVGIEKGAKRGEYGGSDRAALSVSDYANILEQGRPPYMPARPVFADTFREHMGGMKGLKRAIEKGIILKMGKKGIMVNKL